MKKYLYILIFLASINQFAQKKQMRSLTADVKTVEISTEGLDNLILKNTDASDVEVFLNAQEYDNQFINLKNKDGVVSVSFEFEGFETREVIFRKYITKRLQRANAVVKIPKNKKVIIYGSNVDVTSFGVKNTLRIFIENGIVKLNTINANCDLNLYSGNVYANTSKANLDITSKLGNIYFNNTKRKETIKKIITENSYTFELNSVKANVFLTNK